MTSIGSTTSTTPTTTDPTTTSTDPTTTATDPTFALARPAAWNSLAATSSNTSVATVSGYITSSENDFKARIQFVNDQVASMELLSLRTRPRCGRSYAELEATISTLKSQGSFLTNQITSMNASKSN